MWFVLAVVLWSGVLLTMSLDADYTSGELLDHLRGWLETGVLYPHLDAGPPYRVLNYPPLVFVLVRGLTGLGVSALTAGRLVNDLGFLVLVCVMAWWVRARGARGAAVAGTVGLLGASFAVMYAVGQFHIEVWAAAGTVAGFALLDRGRGSASAVVAGSALALACFAKQTQVVPALVALAWAWTARRRRASFATGAFALVGLVGVAAISFTSGAVAWRHMLRYTVGTYSLANLGWQLLSHVAPWLVLLVFAVAIARREGVRATDDAAWWYWVGSLLWSLSAVRRGSSYPYFLDLHLATLVWVGPHIFAGGPSTGSRLWAWLLAAQIVGADVGVGVALGVDLGRLEHVQAGLPDLCARLEGEGRVLAEEAGLVRACGHGAVIHPFIMTSLAEQGLWNPGAFEEAVARGAYPVAVLPFDPRKPVAGVHAERWTAGELAALRTARSVQAAPAGEWVLRW